MAVIGSQRQIAFGTALVTSIFSVALMVLTTNVASSQDHATYPNRPIRIVTSAAGGGSDFDARLIAQGISGPLGQLVIVDNRQGTAPDVVSRAPPDGYSLVVNGQLHWVLPLLQKTLYDPIKDFSPLSLIETSPGLVIVNPSLPVKSIKELIALAKARPGELNYSTASVDGGNHLSTELFKSMAGVNIMHVPYVGAGPAMTAVVGGEVHVMITSGAAAARPLITAGKVRALAVTSAQPTALAPGLPTVSASGLPGYESVSATAIFAPARTPP